MARSKNIQLTKRDFFRYLLIIGGIVLLIGGSFAYWGHKFVGNIVHNELVGQRIYFPEKGSQSLDPATYPDLQQYAGQLVDTPEKAKAYAQGYIGRHLKQIGNGKVYAEVSSEAMKSPTDEKLQKQRATLFQGETLRTLLMTSGYGFGIISKILGIVAYSAFILGGLMLALAVIVPRKI